MNIRLPIWGKRPNLAGAFAVTVTPNHVFFWGFQNVSFPGHSLNHWFPEKWVSTQK